MGITLSHTSALHAIRTVRAQGIDVRAMDSTTFVHPDPWVGKRWVMRAFAPEHWAWQQPSEKDPLHVLVGSNAERVRMRAVQSHICRKSLATHHVLWLDDHAAVPSLPLMFLQMASMMSLPALVMLGFELCGHFTRCADDPINGKIVDGLPVTTSVEELSDFLNQVHAYKGMEKARLALSFVADHAASAPEALLATMYSLPVEELGYGMGPVTLNQRVRIGQRDEGRARYPDIMFGFAPIGINYDGSDHLDLEGLEELVKVLVDADEKEKGAATKAFEDKLVAIREKVVDDAARNRQLAACGRLVLPAFKENLYGRGSLDAFTRDILSCARENYGVDVSEYEKALDDTYLCADRYDLLASMLPFGRPRSAKREVL